MEINGTPSCAVGLEELILVKCPYSQTFYRVGAVPVKIPIAFFTEIGKTTLKFIWNHRRPQIAKAILRKNKAGGISFPDFKVYRNAVVIRQYCIGVKADTETSRIVSPCTCSRFTCDSASTQWGKDSLFNQWCWENWISTCRKFKGGPYLCH